MRVVITMEMLMNRDEARKAHTGIHTPWQQRLAQRASAKARQHATCMHPLTNILENVAYDMPLSAEGGGAPITLAWALNFPSFLSIPPSPREQALEQKMVLGAQEIRQLIHAAARAIGKNHGDALASLRSKIQRSVEGYHDLLERFANEFGGTDHASNGVTDRRAFDAACSIGGAADDIIDCMVGVHTRRQQPEKVAAIAFR